MLWKAKRAGTPDIPVALRKIRLPGYRNIFEYADQGRNPFPDPAQPNLWGTETLAGDWNGRLLIILKDFAETDFVENRPDGRAMYSHAPAFPTNRNLCRFLTEAGHPLDPDGGNRLTCGMLCASASFLLRIGDARSGSVASALSASWPVLEFTMAQMPRLTDIALCGVEAFDTFILHGRLSADRKALQAARKPVRWGKYRVHCTSHTQPTAINTRKDPSGRGASGAEVAQEDWRVICRNAFG